MNKTTTTKKHKKVVSKKPVSDKITETEPKIKVEISAEIKPESTSISYKTTTHNDKNKGLISKFFSSVVGEKKEIGRYDSVVQQVLDLDEKTKALSDEELRGKTQEFRNRMKGIKDEKEIEKKLKELLPEAFAVVREAAHRTIGQKHFPVQLIGAMVLHEGRVAEMRTGEGKTLVSTLVGYLNALPEENQVHLVTVNDYLARVGASWMGQIYNFLGLTVGVIQNQASFYFKLGAGSDENSEKKRAAGLLETYEDGEKQESRTVLDVKHLIPCDRKRAYFDEKADKPVDIVYGVNSEFGFDYLRDNMANTPSEISQKAGHHVAIVDEVDSILIDEARTPLIISAQDKDSSEEYKNFAKIVAKINPDLDYDVDEKRRTVTLTELGVEKIERMLNITHLYDSVENVTIVHHLNQALKAQALFKREKEYVAKDGEIIIVDENTGRLMFGRRYNEGLHQAIEAKEGLNIQPESKTTASITFQNYFRLYKKLAGMTGTASTESEELFKIYKLLVVTIPTNKPIVRKDFVDKIFKTEDGKFKAIARDVKAINAKGQPILIGTTSIEKNSLLAKYLDEAGVKYQLLNAKNHEQEARIIAEAGKKGAVTLATNIAGRGIDIKLGGEPPENHEKMEDWREKHEEVKSLGGLHVIGSERHESRRIDNQLRGRAGRQGDPGESQFYVSLQDFILRIFGGDRVGYYSILPIADDEPISNGQLSWLIEQAQKKIEGQNFDIRKHVTEYDDVINRQRSVIYARRKKVLLNDGFEWQDEVEKSLQRETLRAVSQVQPPKRKNAEIYQKELKTTSEDLKSVVSLHDFDSEILEVLMKDERYKYKRVASFLFDKIKFQMNKRWTDYTPVEKGAMVRFIFLRAIDILWTEHLVTIEHLQDAVRLRGYSQKDPLTEFKEEGLNIFINLLQEVDKEVSRTIFKVTPDLVPAEILENEAK
jgi:preprotein translocase subunit SecA